MIYLEMFLGLPIVFLVFCVLGVIRNSFVHIRYVFGNSDKPLNKREVIWTGIFLSILITFLIL